MKAKKNGIIGKPVIVRANVAGVHAGIVEAFDPAAHTVTLSGAYRLWRFYTRDKSGSVSDVAANGLNPNGLEIAGMTNEAYASIEAWKN